MLAVEHLSKTYPLPPPALRPFMRVAAAEPVEALRDVSLRVEPGEIVGLVGPNGAGKTTLIKLVATLLEPTAGRVLVGGFDSVAAPRDVRAQLGLVLAEDRGLYQRLTGRQNLELFGTLFGLSRRAAGRRADEMLTEVGLAGRDKLVFGYSTGMRARLNLARALLHDPPLVVLDEPTRSLDPVVSAEIADALTTLAAQGRAILLSSHHLDEVETLCPRVVVIMDGQVRYDGPTAALAREGERSATALASFLRSEMQ